MSKYGPTRGEHKFRLLVSLFGLGLMVFAIAYRGISGIAWIEIVMVAGSFFGGTVIWSGWNLFKQD
jgi:hypothetical protein